MPNLDVLLEVLRVPDSVTVFCEDGEREMARSTEAEWIAADVCVTTKPLDGTLPILLSAPESAVKRLRLRWNVPPHGAKRILGDAWERGYGDLEWRSVVAERPLPWYFLAADGKRTHGVGVRTGPNSLCFWQVDSAGVTLTLDVRSGGVGVRLGERVLEAATVMARAGQENETAFASAQAFCKMLCPKPLLPRQPVYGGNNWYYAYGVSSHEQILKDSRLVASVAPAVDNKPFMVIDDGWQITGPNCSGGPWQHSNAAFPDMAGLASDMKALGVRPGLWMRLMTTCERLPSSWFRAAGVLDPSVPGVLDLVRDDAARCVGWGYELIKHDFSTYDIFGGLWGFEMGSEITPDGWRFSDQSRTSAEIVLAFYQAIRDGAGDALVLGCNVIGHLAAGLIEIQRTGDDTSGRDWNRTRKMGVNTLAFRMPQQGAFFDVDADCVGLTNDVPWALNAQWLDLLARSGTPLFVSAAHDAVGQAQLAALKQAFAQAALPQPAGVPLDWMDTTCPAEWRLGGAETVYDWYNGQIASPAVA
jgi:alpha-galactosidase